MTGLNGRLDAAVRARLEVARAAGAARGPNWMAAGGMVDHDGDHPEPVFYDFRRHDEAVHIALNDPATVIRHCERDLRVLERHTPFEGRCGRCQVWTAYPGDPDDGEWGADPSPCAEVRDLAEAYGVDIGEDE